MHKDSYTHQDFLSKILCDGNNQLGTHRLTELQYVPRTEFHFFLTHHGLLNGLVNSQCIKTGYILQDFPPPRWTSMMQMPSFSLLLLKQLVFGLY
mmetsp:Transcript_38623/g.50895  ORF Transcript_38623/g.50895 Transcript_38623/m.50895 type:complete len:95 (-) Transcript_38623:630-914(-)